MTVLHFNTQLIREVNPRRVVHTATDRFGHLYTIGLDIDGRNGFAAVYNQDTLETLHSKTCFGYRIHANDLKQHLQNVADRRRRRTHSRPWRPASR